MLASILAMLKQLHVAKNIAPESVVAVSCGYDTQFAVRLVMGYTISLFTWSFWDTVRIPHDQVRPSP